MATHPSDRGELLALMKIDSDQRLWDRVARIGLQEANSEVDEHLRDAILACVRTKIPPQRVTNIRPSLLISYGIAKAIEMRAWSTLPNWEWIQTSKKANKQHNVYLEAMHIPGATAFSDGHEFKAWLRQQCDGTHPRQILPRDVPGGLSMSCLINSVMHRMEDVIGLKGRKSDQVVLPPVTMDRRRANRIIKAFGGSVEGGGIEDALVKVLTQGKIPAAAQ